MDFPTLGNPTIPHFNAIVCSFVGGRAVRAACCLFYLQGAKLLIFSCLSLLSGFSFGFATLVSISRGVVQYILWYAETRHVITCVIS